MMNTIEVDQQQFKKMDLADLPLPQPIIYQDEKDKVIKLIQSDLLAIVAGIDRRKKLLKELQPVMQYKAHEIYCHISAKFNTIEAQELIRLLELYIKQVQLEDRLNLLTSK